MDASVARRIAALCVLEPGCAVTEIGAGTGALTIELVRLGARVIAIEIDPDLVDVLRERDDLRDVRIEAADALAFDFTAALAADTPWTAVGNLPYNVATPTIARLLEMRRPPERIVAMVQRDVADRLIAKPGSDAYGSLSVFVQYHAVVRRAFVLGSAAFYPKPNVESAVVVLERRALPAVAVGDVAFFQQVVRGAFAYRRKTLANALMLALAIDRERTHRALASLDIDTEIRAERLDLGAFGALADRLAD